MTSSMGTAHRLRMIDAINMYLEVSICMVIYSVVETFLDKRGLKIGGGSK